MSLAQKKVTVTFTYKQAAALHSAAGEILYFGDAMEAHFQDKTKIGPALKAWDKLLSAYIEVERDYLAGKQ